MTSVKTIFAAATRYEKRCLAQSAYLQVMQGELNELQRSIAGNIAACINALNHLVSTSPAAAQSPGIQAIDDALPELGGLARQLNLSNAAQLAHQMLDMLGSMAFYTNATPGTSEQANAPARALKPYIDRMVAHVKELIKLSERLGKS
jgi:hypothetical protein